MQTDTIRLAIKGMTCAACSASVEKALGRKNGVETAVVNLATNTATIYTDGSITAPELILAVEKAGFSAKIASDLIENDSFRISNIQLAIALIFGGLELYIGMSHMLPIPLPLPSFMSMETNAAIFSLIQLILTLIVLSAGYKFFTSGFKNLVLLHPNMDSLVAIGTSSALLYSIYNTVLVFLGNHHAAHNLYYESAAVVVALVLLGKFLEERSKSAAKRAITSLASLVPGVATVERDGIEKEIPSKQVRKGDIVIIKPGLRIPVDGEIIEGESAVDESMLTGESLPVYKELGCKVSGGTICTDGYIKIKATGVGNNTAISQVLKLVTQAQERKAPAARLADQISGIFVPTVVAIAVLSSLIWFIVGKDINFVMNIFVSVLVVACPCALGLATPIAVMAGSGRGANLGILFRGGDVIEATSKVRSVFFDKTGTITHGKLKITKISVKSMNESEFIKLVASAEKGSEHPIAVAVVNYALENEYKLSTPKSLTSFAGRGVLAEVEDAHVLAGTLKLMEEKNISLPANITQKIPTGCTVMYVALNDEYHGFIALSDTIRDDAKHAITRLNSLKIETAMITGDNKSVAHKIADEAGIKTIRAEVLPQNKSEEVEKAKNSGISVAMVGDGINDAPALAAADVGIAVQNSTDAAAESAGIILMRDDINGVADALLLSKKTMQIIKQNLFWAFIYNCVGIPIASGLLYPFSEVLMSPAFAGAAMALSSVCVVTNSLRLTKYNPK